MIDLDGPTLVEVDLYGALDGAQICMPQTLPSQSLYRALHSWNVTQAQFGQPTIPNIGLLAEVLALSLDQEGWNLSDLADGSVLAFAVSDLISIADG